MIEICVNGVNYKFEEMELTYDNATIIDKDVAKENLLLMRKVLNQNSVEFILGYGTLLGAIREKGFIKHDIDIDLVGFSEEKLINSIPDLIKEGFNLVRLEKKQNTYSFMRNGVYIDVYIKKEYGGIVNSFYVNLLGRPFPKKFFKEQKEIEFLGESFRVPKNYEELLVYWYGENWRIPIKNKPSDDEAKITKILKRLMPKKLFLEIKKRLK